MRCAALVGRGSRLGGHSHPLACRCREPATRLRSAVPAALDVAGRCGEAWRVVDAARSALGRRSGGGVAACDESCAAAFQPLRAPRAARVATLPARELAAARPTPLLAAPATAFDARAPPAPIRPPRASDPAPDRTAPARPAGMSAAGGARGAAADLGGKAAQRRRRAPGAGAGGGGCSMRRRVRRRRVRARAPPPASASRPDELAADEGGEALGELDVQPEPGDRGHRDQQAAQASRRGRSCRR